MLIFENDLLKTNIQILTFFGLNIFCRKGFIY